jgi:hypothetical protein
VGDQWVITARRPGLEAGERGYHGAMLYTILIILAIIALALFIFGRR